MLFKKKNESEKEPTLIDNSEKTDKPKKVLTIYFMAVAMLLIFTVTFVIGKKVAAKHRTTVHNKHEDKGAVITLDEFLVNLADGSDHYLKVSVAIEFTKSSGKTAETTKEEIPQIRDAVLFSLSSKKRTDVESLSGRSKLKEEIRKNIDSEMGSKVVNDVYFLNFVTQ